MRKYTKLQIAQMEIESIVKKNNGKIEELGETTFPLVKQLNALQAVFDEIRGMPSEKTLELENLKKIRSNWSTQVKKIESDFKMTKFKAVSSGVVGIGVGSTVATFGPTVAMGVATTFGVASTGTAISTLSGAAATNAALAWLGGGTLLAGGGGMAAGNTLLALAGPVGWVLTSITVIGMGLIFLKEKGSQKRLESILMLISHREINSFKLALVELNERIQKIQEETDLLSQIIAEIHHYGTDYNEMSEYQQTQLGTFVNLMNSSTGLLVNPILGLQPKFTEQDLNEYFRKSKQDKSSIAEKDLKITQIYLANLFYKIELDEIDKKLFLKVFKRDKALLSELGLSKKDLDLNVFNTIESALNNKYLSNHLA